MNINPKEIHGNWRVGWALDSHTLASGPTTHSPLGELVYRVKPGRDRTQIRPIAEVAARFVKEKISIDGYPIHCYLEAIIPIPPSDTKRDFQPVIEIAEKIGEILNVPAPSDYLTKVKATRLMKSTDHGMKRQYLKEAFDIPSLHRNYRCVLLFDDIFDSGETLSAATRVLLTKGSIYNKKNGKPRVFVLTLTQRITKQ